MAVPLEKFVQQLDESGIIAADALKDFLPPKGDPKDATELANELIRKKKLTKFQVEEVSKGNGKSLVLGNYLLMEKIGAGGMGQVFQARHRVMERIVALKFLSASMTKDRSAIARFHREVKAAAKISHPNIVTAYDADQANGVHFLVMELVEGRDLSVLVKRNGPFSVENAVKYILQAAKGLEAAHGKGIVHRDIKPANLLLDAKGTIKILDLGLARLSGDGDGSPQAELTSTGMIMGTVDYMAPEQALDTKSADARADIYALGCSLHYLVTGRATFDGETVMKKLLAHREHPIPSLRAACPETPEWLETVFKKMVAKKVEDRYQTTTALIADLEGGCESSQATTQVLRQSANEQFDQPSTMTFSTPMTSEPTILTSVKQTEDATRPPVDKSKKKLVVMGCGILGVSILTLAIASNTAKRGSPVTNVNQAGAKGRAVGNEKAVVTNPLERWNTPEFQAWVKDVAAMPAQTQVEAVAKMMIEVNPGFDGNLKPRIQNDVVTEIRLFSDVVTNIYPLRALSNTKVIYLFGNTPQNRLSDLSQLSGMPLTSLFIGWSQVTDLSPLKGMSLTWLDCAAFGVTDLSPLRGMPLTGLNCTGTKVSQLSPLSEMPLTWLNCAGTKVSDLSPLNTMQLTYFNCSGTHVSDLTFLRGLPLRELYCSDSQVLNLSPLIGMKLTLLEFFNTPVSDLSPLTGMPLTKLNCSGTKVFDISPLREMPLLDLNLNYTGVTDLSSLGGMKLVNLGCKNTNVSELSPLEDMTTLNNLNVRNTKVTPAEIAVLQKALPKCKIEWDGSDKPVPQNTAVEPGQ